MKQIRINQPAAGILPDDLKLPVKDDGLLAGIISMRDIMEFRLAEMERRSAALQAYVLSAD